MLENFEINKPLIPNFRFFRRNALILLDNNPFCLAFSGDCDHFNIPEYEHEGIKGPLPLGFYTILEDDSPAARHLGPLVFKLIPHTGNQMYGRSDFYIHWDNAAHNFTSSEGCIILYGNMMSKFEAIRAAVKEGKNILEVI